MPALPGRTAPGWSPGSGGGGGGVTVHNLLSGRSSANAHPTSAITDLDAELAALIPLTEKGAANGVATLDAGSKIPAAQIPALALSEFLGTVASEAAMLALVGQRGDWCVRTDLDPDSVFILETDDPTQAANWTNVTGLGVVSVDGNTGAITAAQLLAAILTVDGPGSGLNADLLDGLSSADFQQTNSDLTDLIARWVAASAAGPASLDLAEDTDNGTNRVRVIAPAAVASDRTLTLPDVDGTLLTAEQAAAIYTVVDDWTALGNLGATETVTGVDGHLVRVQGTVDQALALTFALSADQRVEVLTIQDVTGGHAVTVSGIDVWLTQLGTAPDQSTDPGGTVYLYKAFDIGGTTYCEVSVQQVDAFTYAIGDETTAITTGTAKITFRAPFACSLVAVRASLTTASSSGIPTFDINESGATLLSTKLTVDANEKTSTTAATPAVISDNLIADDAEMTIDVDVAGTGAAGAKITLYVRRR